MEGTGHLDMEEINLRLQLEQQFLREAEEGLHIIKEYGIQAWYDLAGWVDYPMAQRSLNRMRRSLEREERYEDCAFVRDLIPLFNTGVTTE